MSRYSGLLFHLPFLIFVLIIIVHVIACIFYALWSLLPLSLFPLGIIFTYLVIALRKK
ncbi:MAG: hypothetical protein ACP6IS_07870 [Candidatus Asgardarchaeia archaeon]